MRLARDIKGQRIDSGETILEQPEAGESQRNGIVEGAAGIMEGMVRTVKSALGFRIGATIRPTDVIIPWLVEHASQL